MRYRKETDLVTQICQQLTYQQNAGRLLFHRLNSGTFYSQYVNKAGQKKTYAIRGQKKGTADIMMVMPIPGTTGFAIHYIECKIKDNAQEPEQEEFQRKVESLGAHYWLVYDVRELQKILATGGIVVDMG